MSFGENIRFFFKVWFYELPKAMASCIIGLLVGIWPVIPFTLVILVITLIRFPINVYKTFKVAITSVILKINLRIMILLILPFAHILFPIIVLIIGLFGALGYFVGYSIVCVYEGKHWFKSWKDFPEGIEEYWKAHVAFVNETVSQYDHPTGIPLNWDGTMYGFPFGPMKVIFGFILTLYGLIVTGFGTFIIITVKWNPINYYVIFQYFKVYFREPWVKVVTFSPFFLIGLCFMVILSPVLYILVLLVGVFLGLRCPYIGITYDNLKYGFIESFNILKEVDEQTKKFSSCKGMVLLNSYEKVYFERNIRGSHITGGCPEVKSDLYWDLFITRCIKESATLIKKNWILKDDVEAVDPSIVMTIPAVAALSILADSVKSDIDDKEAIVWGDDLVCTSSTRPRGDNIVNLLWPKILELKKSLEKTPFLIEKINLNILIAKICSNQEVVTGQLNVFLDSFEDNNSTENNSIRSKLIDLSLSLSRVQPMTERLNKIVSHDYEDM